MSLLIYLGHWYTQHPFWASAAWVILSSFVFSPFNEEIRDLIYRRPGKRLLLVRRKATQATIERLREIEGSDRALFLDLFETGAFQLFFSLGMTLFAAGFTTNRMVALKIDPHLRIEAFAVLLLLGLILSVLLTSFAVLTRCLQLRKVQRSIERLTAQKTRMDTRL